ncbi:hypothetical protein D3C81_1990290 [compost metagenome]
MAVSPDFIAGPCEIIDGGLDAFSMQETRIVERKIVMIRMYIFLFRKTQAFYEEIFKVIGMHKDPDMHNVSSLKFCLG